MESSGDFVTAPKYYWSCCFVCRKVSSQSAPLKRCSRCHCMFYCSKEHQTQDWKRHKRLCSYLSTAAEEVGAETFFGREFRFVDAAETDAGDLVDGNGDAEGLDEVEKELGKLDLETKDSSKSTETQKNSESTTEKSSETEAVSVSEPDEETEIVEEEDKAATWKTWTKFRVNAVKMCEILMGKKLEEWEKEIFLFPRACRVCRVAKRDGMIDCHSCGGVTYCSQEHRQSNESRHQLFCKELKYAMVCDNFESTVSVAVPAIPSDIDTENVTDLGNDIVAHLKKFIKVPTSKTNDNEVNVDEMEFRFLTNSLSSPLTLLRGLLTGIKGPLKEDLVVHVAGSDIIEMLGIIKWEYILHRLPKVKSLRFVFIGLQLTEEEEGECSGIGECQDCSEAGRTMKYEIRKKTYKAYAESSDFSTPDIVCVFNCGFHEFSGTDQDTWLESLPYLAKNPGVPLLFTSYTKTEAGKDLDLIQKSCPGVEVLTSASRNPFRSHRPIRDFEFDNDCDVFYSNNFVSVVVKNG